MSTETDNTFYSVMDLIDEYDKQITSMNELYSQAMLSLAQIKFSNPYSSVSASGFKPTPALLKHNCKDNQLEFSRDGKFVKRIGKEDQQLKDIDDIGEVQEEQLKEQQGIQQQIRDMIKRGDMSQREIIVSRFGNINNQSQMLQASTKFRSCLTQILKLATKKKQIIQSLSKIQQSITKQKPKQCTK